MGGSRPSGALGGRRTDGSRTRTSSLGEAGWERSWRSSTAPRTAGAAPCGPGSLVASRRLRPGDAARAAADRARPRALRRDRRLDGAGASTRGSVLLERGCPSATLRVGDVITFRPPAASGGRRPGHPPDRGDRPAARCSPSADARPRRPTRGCCRWTRPTAGRGSWPRCRTWSATPTCCSAGSRASVGAACSGSPLAGAAGAGDAAPGGAGGPARPVAAGRRHAVS